MEEINEIISAVTAKAAVTIQVRGSCCRKGQQDGG